MPSDLVCCFKMSWLVLHIRMDTDELTIIRTGTNGMDYGKRKFAFRDVFAKAFVIRRWSILQILVIIPNLEEDSDDIDQWHAIAKRHHREKGGRHIVLQLQACISLTARRSKPPVLLFTISTYSSSVGQVRLSLQKRSSPCPRWTFIISSLIRVYV